MKKETFRLTIRFLVGTALSLMLCAGMIMTEKLGSNKPLIQQASGLKGTETVMTVDGEPVSAEEYLYLVSYSAQTMSYYGITDLSTELDEVMDVSDRILVMYEGEIVGELDPKTTTVEELGLYMAGAKRQEVREGAK